MEPTTSTGAGILGWKLIGGLAGMGAIGAGLAAIVVMCLMTPRGRKEWAVGLISTVISSISGGAAVVEYFELQHWTSSFFGLVAMFGLVFVCGLPGWAMVRWTFNSIRAREGETVEDVLRDLRNGGKHDA